MAIRTIQFYGLAYGNTPVDVRATANNNVFFDNEVDTLDQPFPTLPDLDLINEEGVLFSLDIDTSFTGTIPITCAVTNGIVNFGQIMINYNTRKPNPVYTPEQYEFVSNYSYSWADKISILVEVANPPLSSEDIAALENPDTPPETVQEILNVHNLQPVVPAGPDQFVPITFGTDSTDPRSNVKLDGVLQTPDKSLLNGAWWWKVESGSVLSFDIDVGPAVI